MNCAELQNSLIEIEDGGSPAQRSHLKTCADCSALVAELNLITSAAIELRELNEPSPRVWNSIEIALRQEGIIHPPRPSRSLLPAFTSRWGWSRWLVPAAAALLIVVGIYVHRQSEPQQIAQVTVNPAVAQATVGPTVDPTVAGLNAGLNDADLLQEISQQTPAIQAQYQDNLRHVNAYIHDAQGIVDSNPNDEEARRSLMEAYQEKAMLFELAMDRSLP